MGLIRSLSNFTKRVGLWFLAAGITLTVFFIAVLIYQLSVYEPDPPTAADCQAMQTLTTVDTEAQLYLHQCQRGNDLSWKGYEVWTYKVVTEEWQRLATAPLASGCLQLSVDERQLTIMHNNSRGELNIPATSFIYELKTGGARTLSIATERVDQCTLITDDRLLD
ncbi:hypothetical protein ACQ5ES_01275 [Pseudidiomarina sp. E22-M8]|uniref:hypothetical protein n=1 Tax=Pseudidiomarina sp. E22-M8 TaxID=3424768 RepID=UPI00403CD0FC